MSFRTNFDPTRRGYSVDQVARLYDLSRQRIYDELNAGRLPSMKVGARRVITQKHLEQWEATATADAAIAQ